jgi:hypothetical protein
MTTISDEARSGASWIMAAALTAEGYHDLAPAGLPRRRAAPRSPPAPPTA